MELYQRLKDYFHLSSIQANEILATYQEEAILENFRYVEGKILAGQVRTIGAYTLKAIKENYRSQPNLFEREYLEKQKALQEKIQLKRELEWLKRQYDEERDISFQRCLKELPSDRIDVLKDEASQEIEKSYGQNYRLLDTLSARRFKDRILACAGFPKQEEWFKGVASAHPLQRVSDHSVQ